MLAYTSILLALTSCATALPADLHERQVDGSSIPPVPLPSPITVETSIPPVSLPSPTSVSIPSASPSVAPTPGQDYYPGYPCPDGYLLSYAEDQRTYPYAPDVFKELGIWGDWLKAPQYGDVQIDPSDDGINGSSRLRSAPGFSAITETLINTTNSDTFYQADSNLTAPIVRDDNSIVTWSHVFQTYANETEEAFAGTDSPVTTVKIFANACGQVQNTTIDQLDFLFNYTFATIDQILEALPFEPVSLASDSGSPTIQPSSASTTETLGAMTPDGTLGVSSTAGA